MSIKNIIASIEKDFGKEAVCGTQPNVEFLSSGSILIDRALGGGWAKGRIHEVLGFEASGKTSVSLHACIQAQKEGKAVGYIDTEQAMDLEYAKGLGLSLDEDKWLMSQPDNGEQALEIAKKMIASPDFGVVVIDSVAALTPLAIIQGEAGDAKIGLRARLMSSQLPVIIPLAKKSNCVVIFINQYREKIGVAYGNPNIPTGGNALKFYATQRVEMSKFGTEKEGDIEVAIKTRVKVLKNKVAPPFRKAEIPIRFGVGLDLFAETLDLAVELGIIKKAGSWFSYEEKRLGQGSGSVISLFEEDSDFYNKVRNEVIQKVNVSN